MHRGILSFQVAEMMVVITEDKAKAVTPAEPCCAQSPHDTIAGSGHEGRMPEGRDGSPRASDGLSCTQSSTSAAEMVLSGAVQCCHGVKAAKATAIKEDAEKDLNEALHRARDIS